MGAWIEIPQAAAQMRLYTVAPFVGAWIEIAEYRVVLNELNLSLPSWERGLKCFIEALFRVREGRSLRGSVD